MAVPWQLAKAQPTKRGRTSKPRTVLEELPCLNANWLARHKLFPKDYSTRRYDLSLVVPAIHTLALGPRCAELVLATGRTQSIGITWLCIGGMVQSIRPAFECPGCGHNAFKLFHHGGHFSGCYRCIGIPYASQQRWKKNRPQLQAARLRLFLSGLPNDTKDPARPELMGKRTYARFIARLHKLEASSSRKHKPLTKTFSHKVLHPLTAYDSQRHAIV